MCMRRIQAELSDWLLDPPEGCCLEKFVPLMEWWGPVLHHLPAHCWLTGSPGAGPRAGALCHDDTLRDQSVPGGRVILMAGPESGAYGPSLYRDDTFRLSVKFSEGYPLEPPEVRSQRAWGQSAARCQELGYTAACGQVASTLLSLLAARPYRQDSGACAQL